MLLDQLLSGEPSTSAVGMERLATVLEATVAAQIYSQETEVWRSWARQLCELSGGSEQETQARARLRTALEHLESDSLVRDEPAR